jgi:glycolate oxidase iron-sulfur subunit
VFTPEVLPSVLALIRAAGFVPFVPSGQGCCGALAAHAGDREQTLELGRRFIEVFESAESIVIPSAGCSAHLRQLGELFADDPAWSARAERVAARVEDLVVWLGRNADRLEFRPDARRIVFQKSCHLRHAQGIDGVAETVLARIPGVELLEAPRADLCCGSAGAWSMAFPEMASERRRQKLEDLLSVAPELVLTANPGCELFLDTGAGRVEIRHLAPYLAGLLPDR